MKPYAKATRAMLAEARRRGRLKGEGCADVQYLPGGGRDTARDAAGRARAMLRDYEAAPGDETVCPPAWLAGEWADEPTTRDVAEACGVNTDRDPDGTVAQEVCDAFVAAADAAWLGFILRHLRHVARGQQ